MTTDVCLVLEGTYPYVSGGVSSWVHALITNLPEVSFSLVYLDSRPHPGRTPRYQLPANVVGLTEYFIHEPRWLDTGLAHQQPSDIWQQLSGFHEAMANGAAYDGVDLLRRLCSADAGSPTPHELFTSPDAWELLVERYRAQTDDASFLDFFWTFRFTHLPLFSLLDVPLPAAHIYHAPSTGFAGFVGAIAKVRTGARFVLTEHGVYVREREIELAQADWIYSQPSSGPLLQRRPGLFHEWWIRLFRFLSKFAYDAADSIVSIAAVNQRYQLRYGADPAKMTLIANGIDVDRLSVAHAGGPLDATRFVAVFVGRVVSIKDVPTFIRAVKIAEAVIPNLTVYIVGGTDEEPEYYADCRRLVELLDLSSTVEFTGPADVREYYRQADVLVLTSLSEGQPLVILEANCAGVPVVATDVGACRELLHGTTPDDEALGASGLITPPASPRETASALIRLWRDPELRRRMGRAGQERVQRFYRQESLYAAYRELYGRYLPMAAGAERST